MRTPRPTPQHAVPKSLSRPMPAPDPAPTPPDWDALTGTMYAELRDIAASMMRTERPGHTLQPTALANEACLRIARRGLPDLPREQRLALAARVLEQVLIDHARRRTAVKRGGGAAPLRIDLDEPLLADDPEPLDFETLHAALSRLRSLHPRQAEVVTLRILAGLTTPQTAALLGVSPRTVEADWTVARAWLRRELSGATPEASP